MGDLMDPEHGSSVGRDQRHFFEKLLQRAPGGADLVHLFPCLLPIPATAPSSVPLPGMHQSQSHSSSRIISGDRDHGLSSSNGHRSLPTAPSLTSGLDYVPVAPTLAVPTHNTYHGRTADWNGRGQGRVAVDAQTYSKSHGAFSHHSHVMGSSSSRSLFGRAVSSYAVMHTSEDVAPRRQHRDDNGQGHGVRGGSREDFDVSRGRQVILGGSGAPPFHPSDRDPPALENVRAGGGSGRNIAMSGAQHFKERTGAHHHYSHRPGGPFQRGGLAPRR